MWNDGGIVWVNGGGICKVDGIDVRLVVEMNGGGVTEPVRMEALVMAMSDRTSRSWSSLCRFNSSVIFLNMSS